MMFRPAAIALATLVLALPGRAPAQETPTVLRDRLHIVSSGSSQSVTFALVDVFNTRYADVSAPRVDITGSTAALDRFCAGIGAATPDIAISSRRIPRSVFDGCRANGVTDIIELRIGVDALIIATRRGDPLTALTERQIYTALAADLAVDDEFQTNQLDTWSQLQPQLPALPIRAILPNRDSGSRTVFNDFVMEGGCREVKAVRSIFSASFRVRRCTTLRADGRVTEATSSDLPGALLTALPGTIGAISYEQLLESGGNLVAVQLGGVMPTAATIGSLDYPVTRTLYLYAKRQHSRSVMGVSVVRGIREFTTDAVSESVGGPGGTLARVGLVPLAPHLRLAQQQIASRERLLSR